MNLPREKRGKSDCSIRLSWPSWEKSDLHLVWSIDLVRGFQQGKEGRCLDVMLGGVPFLPCWDYGPTSEEKIIGIAYCVQRRRWVWSLATPWWLPGHNQPEDARDEVSDSDRGRNCHRWSNIGESMLCLTSKGKDQSGDRPFCENAWRITCTRPQ